MQSLQTLLQLIYYYEDSDSPQDEIYLYQEESFVWSSGLFILRDLSGSCQIY